MREASTVSSASPARESSARESPARHPTHPAPKAEDHVLLAVVYADVFDFALTRDELFARVLRSRIDRATFEACLERLSAEVVYDTGKYVGLRGREHLVELRRLRTDKADVLWQAALRFACWFRHVPFVRSVAVSGSLAVGNCSDESDVDFFCITAENRLWLARLFMVALSKLTRHLTSVFPVYLCPNYVLDEGSLVVADRNLFTAHEIMQAVPLWGHSHHAAFLAANRWTTAWLPNMTPVSTRLPILVRGARRAADRAARATGDAPEGMKSGSAQSERSLRSWPVRVVEQLLAGPLGDCLNRTAHRVFLRFYRLRAGRLGRPWHRLAGAYQLGRYTVPEGGYVSVVSARFRRRVRQVFGDRMPQEELDALVPPPEESDPIYDWPALFAREYGSAA